MNFLKSIVEELKSPIPMLKEIQKRDLDLDARLQILEDEDDEAAGGSAADHADLDGEE